MKTDIASFVDGGRGHEPRGAGNIYKPEKAMEDKDTAIEQNLNFSPMVHFGLLTSRTKDNKLVLFYTSKSVVICYSNNRKLIQLLPD